MVVDDVPANLNLLRSALEPQGYQLIAAPSGEVALRLAPESEPDLILLDVMMPGIDGFETCRRLKANPQTSNIPILFITANDQIASLETGFEAGGVDYVTKPFKNGELLARVRNHLQLNQLANELRESNVALERKNHELALEIKKRQQAEASKEQVVQRLNLISELEAKRWGLKGFVGDSPTMRGIVEKLRKLQQLGSNTNVLITGESGTGKELMARAVHYGSLRQKGPFVAVNCTAMPGELVESILFGHQQGAFTGATHARKGLFEQADGGSLFLDEVGDMPLELQVKLLRVLETGRVTPLGGSRELNVDVRIISATNAELDQGFDVDRFRQDLFYRLSGFTIHLPPLRDRKDDIQLLSNHFLKMLSDEMGIPVPCIQEEAMSALLGYSFPGNIRELKNLMERSLIESGGGDIEAGHLFFSSRSEPSTSVDKDTYESNIIDYVKLNHSINNKECRELLNVGMQRACYLLRKLYLQGILNRESSKRWTQYTLA